MALLDTLTPQEQIAALYVGYYDRAPNPGGFEYWVNELNGGRSLVDIATNFADQVETTTEHPFFTNPTEAEAETFITKLYLNLFDRQPDAEGLEYWTGELVSSINGEDGAPSIGQIILNIIGGAQNTEEFGNDRTTVQNKIEVGIAWAEAAEASGITTDADYLADDALVANSAAIIDDVTDEASSVANALDQIGDFFTPEGTPGNDIFLTSSTDVSGQKEIISSDDDDTFYGYIVQNEFAGGVSNSLSSADRLDGAGGNDRLYAEITGEFVGVVGNVSNIDIQPRLTSIEEIDIEVRESTFLTIDDLVGGPVVVDGKHIVGHDVIGSYYSDGDLKIENLTTKETADVSSARNTSDITIKMDHTDNFNTDGDASDLTVLFDNDYLLSGQTSEGIAEFFLLDEKAELNRLNGESVEGRLDEIDKNGLRFEIDGEEIELSFDPALIDIDAPAGETVDTHQQFVDALQAPLAQLIVDGVVPVGTRIELFEYTTLVTDDTGKTLNRTGLNDGTLSDLIPAIRLISGDGSPITALGFTAPDEVTGAFDVFGEFRDEFETAEEPISIDIDLNKAGRGGEGGDLIIGGKADSVSAGIAGGIEVFNVNVMGGSELPSWIGAINSTLDALDTINVATDPRFAGTGDVADLTIGEIGGAAGNNGGETDVRVFDSTEFEGDLTAFASLDEFGNGAHSYLLGVGDDTLEIDFDEFGGAAGDSLVINTGAGNDTLVLDSVDAEEGGADLEFLDIETGAGDDIVFFDTDNENQGPLVSGDTTTGDGASISTSAGEDRVYMNDGASNFDELDITILGDADNFELFGASLQVTVDGVISEWVDIDYDRSTYTTSREDIRDAIQAAVASNSALQGMIEIVELADGTLQARSLVSGTSTFTIDLEGPVASNALITNANGYAVAANIGGADEPALDPAGAPVADQDGWPLLNAQPTLNQVNVNDLAGAWGAWNPGSTAFADLTSPGSFASDDANVNFDGSASNASNASDIVDQMDDLADLLDSIGTLTGPNGNNSDDNVINAGMNDDLIVLSTNAVNGNITNDENGNGNTVEFTGQFGWDTIVNFTIGATSGSTTVAAGSSDLNDNDIMDFFSYLDAAADARSSSAPAADARINDDVAYTFNNLMGATSSGTALDHNEIRLMDFSELWTDLDGAPASSTAPANFDSLTAANVDTWLEEQMSATGSGTLGSAGGANATAVGNTFLILIGKDGDIEIDQTGTTQTFDASHADNQFWAFEAEVTSFTSTGTDNFDYSVSLLGGVDLAETQIANLTLNEFGIV